MFTLVNKEGSFKAQGSLFWRENLFSPIPETISQYYVSMAMPSGSHLRENLNRSLAKIMDQEAWVEMMDRYIGRTN